MAKTAQRHAASSGSFLFPATIRNLSAIVQMRSLVAPVDFSETSLRRWSEAPKFAGLITCPLTFIHVVQPPPMSVCAIGPVVDGTAQFVAEPEKSAARRLAKLERNLQEAGVEVDTVLRTGRPETQLTDSAKKLCFAYRDPFAWAHGVLRLSDRQPDRRIAATVPPPGHGRPGDTHGAKAAALSAMRTARNQQVPIRRLSMAHDSSLSPTLQ
jgi:nucleotide-binding universal stress UspA family protein